MLYLISYLKLALSIIYVFLSLLSFSPNSISYTKTLTHDIPTFSIFYSPPESKPITHFIHSINLFSFSLSKLISLSYFLPLISISKNHIFFSPPNDSKSNTPQIFSPINPFPRFSIKNSFAISPTPPTFYSFASTFPLYPFVSNEFYL
jgi:hypothetical protein